MINSETIRRLPAVSETPPTSVVADLHDDASRLQINEIAGPWKKSRRPHHRNSYRTTCLSAECSSFLQ
jgi:hypothetical protein